MLSTIIENYNNTLLKEIKSYKEEKICQLIDDIQSIVGGEENLNHLLVRTLIPKVITEVSKFDEEDMLEEYCVEILESELSQLREIAPYLCQKIKIDVKMKGLEKFFSRTMEIPIATPISYFCYAIMSAFGTGTYHHFELTYQGKDYYPGEIGIETMNAIPLFLLGIKKNARLTVTYDFGESFEFVATVKDIIPCNKVLSSEDIKILKAKGNSIWEDNRYFMELYYLDRDEYEKRIEEEGLEGYFDDFIDDTEPDIEEMNDMLLSDIYFRKDNYEQGEEYFNL